jgi:hypothetical protein
LLLICLGFFVVILSLTCYAVSSHNSIRKAISINPATTTGKIVSFSSGKGVQSAAYEFSYKQQKYYGSTFSSYNGVVGDNICIVYLSDKPNINLFCNDIAMEDIFNDSFLFSLKMFSVTVGFISLLLLWKIFTNDKKIIIEFTSRKNNYH